jgi:hypothetical protein
MIYFFCMCVYVFFDEKVLFHLRLPGGQKEMSSILADQYHVALVNDPNFPNAGRGLGTVLGLSQWVQLWAVHMEPK